MTRFDFIAEQATNQNQARTNKEIAAFHYFNPNGLVKRKRDNDQTISDLVGSGAVSSGWLLAYGGLHDTWVDNIISLYKQQRVSSSKLQAAVELLLSDCVNQENAINSVTEYKEQAQ